jgi:hypothetical protein
MQGWASLGGFGQRLGGTMSNQQMGWTSPASRGVMPDYSGMAPGKQAAMQQHPGGMYGGYGMPQQPGGMASNQQLGWTSPFAQGAPRPAPGMYGGYGMPQRPGMFGGQPPMMPQDMPYGMPNYQDILAQMMGNSGPQWGMPPQAAAPMPQPTPAPAVQPPPAAAPAPRNVARAPPPPPRPQQPAAPVEEEPLGRRLLSRGYWASR